MSCLFKALSNFIADNHETLRSKICDFLEQNPILFADIRVNDIVKWEKDSNYIINMRNSETWGGAIEIKSFCEMYKIQVNVHIANNRIINFIPLDGLVSIINITWNGNHFTSN
jgi:hypothetical protein